MKLIGNEKRVGRTAAQPFLYVLLMVVSLNIITNSQDLPDKIRGYKVHQAKIVVKTSDQRPEDPQDEEKNDAFVKIGEPKLIRASIIGVTFELEAELDSIEHSGKVDFLTFNDFRVNGTRVEIEEYKRSFKFEKNKTITLPEPFEIFLNTPRTLLGVLGEITDSKDEWRVTGRVFVYGRFKKAGFKFKRVVPVDIDILIKNPRK